MFDWGIKVRATTGAQNKNETYQLGAFDNRDLAYQRIWDLWTTHVPSAKSMEHQIDAGIEYSSDSYIDKSQSADGHNTPQQRSRPPSPKQSQGSIPSSIQQAQNTLKTIGKAMTF